MGHTELHNKHNNERIVAIACLVFIILLIVAFAIKKKAFNSCCDKIGTKGLRMNWRNEEKENTNEDV